MVAGTNSGKSVGWTEIAVDFLSPQQDNMSSNILIRDAVITSRSDCELDSSIRWLQSLKELWECIPNIQSWIHEVMSLYM